VICRNKFVLIWAVMTCLLWRQAQVFVCVIIICWDWTWLWGAIQLQLLSGAITLVQNAEYHGKNKNHDDDSEDYDNAHCERIQGYLRWRKWINTAASTVGICAQLISITLNNLFNKHIMKSHTGRSHFTTGLLSWKSHTNQTQNSHLRQGISWGLGD